MVSNNQVNFVLFRLKYPGLIVISTDAGLTKTWAVDFNKDQRNEWIWTENLCSEDRLIIPNNSVIYLDRPYQGRQMVSTNTGLCAVKELFFRSL